MTLDWRPVAAMLAAYGAGVTLASMSPGWISAIGAGFAGFIIAAVSCKKLEWKS